MARKRFSDEDCLKLLREIELQLATGSDVVTACRSAGISDATFIPILNSYEVYSWPLPQKS